MAGRCDFRRQSNGENRLSSRQRAAASASFQVVKAVQLWWGPLPLR